MHTNKGLTSGFLLSLVGCVILCGCQVLDPGKEREAEAERQATTEQWRALRELVDTFTGIVEGCGHQIATESNSLQIKRSSVLDRLRASEALRQLLWFDRPAEAMIDLWTLCIQLVHYFGDGDGKDAFGPQQPLAIGAAEDLLQHMEGYVRRKLNPQQFAKVQKGLEEFAARHPITGAYARFGVQPSEAAPKETAGLLSWLPSFSLNPLTGLGSKGLSEGAQAVLAFSKVADRFTDVVNFLPTQLGWRMELLQYDLAESKLLRDATGSIADANASLRDVAKTAADLPTSVRVETEKLLTDLEPRLREVQATLVQVKEASASLDRTGATYDQTAKSIEVMAREVDAALKTFQELMVFLRGDPGEKDPNQKKDAGEGGKPFDILDYDRTARSIAAMATQLQGTLSEFQQLIADDRLSTTVADATAETRKAAEGMIWSVGLGVVSTVAAILVLLVIYRFLVPRPKAQAEFAK